MPFSDVGRQIGGAGGGALAVGGVKPADLFLGSDIRNPVSRASLAGLGERGNCCILSVFLCLSRGTVTQTNPPEDRGFSVKFHVPCVQDLDRIA